jgi:signal transduction histidine kinase/DNA-binding response OmpR family regulator/PAS domain-containing protein
MQKKQQSIKDKSVGKYPNLKLFLGLMIHAAVPMMIVIFTLSYSKWFILLAFVIACIMSYLIVHELLNKTFSQLIMLSQWIHHVSSGKLEMRKITTNNESLQSVIDSFEALVNHLIQLRDTCNSICLGDYSKCFSKIQYPDSIESSVEKLRHKLINFGLIAERHLTFLNNVPVPIIILTRSLEVEYMNRAAEQMFKKPISKCLGTKCKNLLKSDQCITEECKAFRAMETDMTLTTLTNIHVDNQIFPVRYTNVPIHDLNSQIMGVMKFIIDISNEMELVHLAERISSGDFSIEIDSVTEDKRLVSALNKMTQTLKMATEENAMQNWIKTGQTELNKRLRGEQDMQNLAQNVIFFLCDYLNAPVGTFYTEKDTKLKLIASYAYTHRKSLSNDVEMGEGLIGQAALERKVITFNELPDNYIYMQSGLGKEKPDALIVVPLIFQDKVVGVMEFGAIKRFTKLQMNFLESVSESIAVAMNTSKARTRMATLLAHSQSQSEELKVQQEELRQAYDDLEEQTKRLQDSESSLQQQHEELSQSNKALEKQAQLLEEQKESISKKNEALKKQQVIIEQKANDLEKANTYKSEFLANMSHELRTPLNSILLLSGIIAENKESNLTEKQKEFAHTIKMCGTDLLNLINEVLDLSKVESGKMEIYPERFYIQDIVSTLIKTFEPVANQKQIEFKTEMRSDIPAQMYTDQQRLEQILKNILSNAFKFTKKGKVVLSIKRPEIDFVADQINSFDRDTFILFEIEDTGLGIPIDKQDLIFEAFHQGDGTTKRRYGGTGLGLSIVKRMVNLLGGQVILESEVGKGTTFKVVLPEIVPKDWPHVVVSLESEPEETSEPVDPVDPVENKSDICTDNIEDVSDIAEPSPPMTKDKLEPDHAVLIISNNEKIARHIHSIADKQKFVPKIVTTPGKALEICQKSIPKGIILDLGLPDWTCWMLYIQLQKRKNFQHIPIHWISGLHLASSDSQNRMFFLKKEDTKSTLQSVVKSMNALCKNGIKTALILCKKDSDLLKHFETVLQIRCIQHSDISSALKYISNNDVNILVLDVSYAELSNIQYIDQLAKKASEAQMPTLFMTDADIWDQEWIIPLIDEDGVIIQQQKINVMERMTDETLLFFHRLKKANTSERDQTHLIHNKDEILKGKKFLLVDDDMRNVFAISSVLEARGSTIVVGRNGNEGMKCLSENPDIDLVLMDIMMPEMDGYEAISKIREMPDYKTLPIIALTAKAMKKDREKCIQAGADDYMPKPVYPDKLISMLRLWLNK